MTTAPARRAPDGKLTALDRGLQILGFVQDNGQVTAADIVAGLDIPSSTVYRYLARLERAGYLVEMDGQLLAGDRMADRSTDRRAHLMEFAHPVLNWLRGQSGLTVALTVRAHTAALCLDVRRGRGGVVAYHPGEVLALYAGASATPLLATAPAAVRNQVLRAKIQRFTAATPDKVGLRAELATIRRDGYALSRGWLTPGMTAVGVPVLTDGGCVCALSLVGPDGELADADPAVQWLLRGAREIARRITDSDATSWQLPDEERFW
jgi:DNA-binding IclR family transcriptional regulator